MIKVRGLIEKAGRSGVNRRYEQGIDQKSYQERNQNIENKRRVYIHTVLVNGNPKNRHELSTALLTWIQEFGFRNDDEIALTGLELTYASTELNSTRFLKEFRDDCLHEYFLKGNRSGKYKKAKNFINAMISYYRTEHFKIYSYIQ